MKEIWDFFRVSFYASFKITKKVTRFGIFLGLRSGVVSVAKQAFLCDFWPNSVVGLLQISRKQDCSWMKVCVADLWCYLGVWVWKIKGE